MENLILDSIFKPEVQLWLFLCMHNNKFRKKIAKAKTWSICQNFTPKRKLVVYNFDNKVVD